MPKGECKNSSTVFVAWIHGTAFLGFIKVADDFVFINYSVVDIFIKIL